MMNSEAWNGDALVARVGVRRDGGAEAAVESTAVFTGGADGVRRRYRLFVLVHLVRQVVETQTQVLTLLGDAAGTVVLIHGGGANPRRVRRARVRGQPPPVRR